MTKLELECLLEEETHSLEAMKKLHRMTFHYLEHIEFIVSGKKAKIARLQSQLKGIEDGK